MSEINRLIEQLRIAYAAADRTNPGRFQFVASVTTDNGDCVCVLAVDSADARQRAAKALTG